MHGERGFLLDLAGAGTNRHLFRAGAPQPTARGHESWLPLRSRYSLARHAKRGAIEFAFALRLRLGLGTHLLGRSRSAIIGKPPAYFHVKARQNPEEIPGVHVLRTANHRTASIIGGLGGN